MKTRVLVLGAGFGGMELATRLDASLADAVDITVIDRSEWFAIGFSKFEVMFGRRRANDVRSWYRDRAATRVDFRHEEITAIDPADRRVVTSAGTYEADILVVALGADVRPDLTPGLVEGGHEFYTFAGAEALASILPGFRAGTALIAILGGPYKCPPAPFECALQLHDYLVERGNRDAVAIKVMGPPPVPLPVSSQGSEVILRLFAERDIDYLPGQAVESVDSPAKRVLVRDRDPVAFDLLLAVPAHRVPAVVTASGLAPNGWVDVDPATLQTSYPGVYAIGDVAHVPVGGTAVPKAGAFADRAAGVVAAQIERQVRGSGDVTPFDGRGTCFLEFGGGAVAKVEADFLGGPEPIVRFAGPSRDFRPDKETFASDRLARWFR